MKYPNGGRPKSIEIILLGKRSKCIPDSKELTCIIYYATFDLFPFDSSGQGELRSLGLRRVKPIEAVDHKQILKDIVGTGREK